MSNEVGPSDVWCLVPLLTHMRSSLHERKIKPTLNLLWVGKCLIVKRWKWKITVAWQHRQTAEGIFWEFFLVLGCEHKWWTLKDSLSWILSCMCVLVVFLAVCSLKILHLAEDVNPELEICKQMLYFDPLRFPPSEKIVVKCQLYRPTLLVMVRIPYLLPCTMRCSPSMLTCTLLSHLFLVAAG